jgi:large subunit ribosomal protein L17
MRHLKQGRKLGRTPAHRTALMRNMAAALFRHEAITTTRPKAKEVQRFAERLITVAKRALARDDSLQARRTVSSRLQDEEMAAKVCDDLAGRFAAREGGYTRIVKLAVLRKGDAGQQVRLELTEIKAAKAE